MRRLIRKREKTQQRHAGHTRILSDRKPGNTNSDESDDVRSAKHREQEKERSLQSATSLFTEGVTSALSTIRSSADKFITRTTQSAHSMHTSVMSIDNASQRPSARVSVHQQFQTERQSHIHLRVAVWR